MDGWISTSSEPRPAVRAELRQRDESRHRLLLRINTHTHTQRERERENWEHSRLRETDRRREGAKYILIYVADGAASLTPKTIRLARGAGEGVAEYTAVVMRRASKKKLNFFFLNILGFPPRFFYSC